jgi:hypothetical protein
MKHTTPYPNEFEVCGVFNDAIYNEVATVAAKIGCRILEQSGSKVRLRGNRQRFAFAYPHAANVQDIYDHDAECEEKLHEDLRRLRTDSNRFLRQRNELLEKMRMIQAHHDLWAGGREVTAEASLESIGQIAVTAICDVTERNGR